MDGSEQSTAVLGDGIPWDSGSLIDCETHTLLEKTIRNVNDSNFRMTDSESCRLGNLVRETAAQRFVILPNLAIQTVLDAAFKSPCRAYTAKYGKNGRAERELP
jgi:hypothetical protein